jgi:hypothetical protein
VVVSQWWFSGCDFQFWLSLIQRVNSKTPDRSPIGILVADIKRQAVDFSLAMFNHVHRSINGAAHILDRTCDVF